MSLLPMHVTRKNRDRTFGHSLMLDSAISEHLSATNTLAANYNGERSAVLHRAWIKQHLKVLEPIYILLNRPSSCKQSPRHSLHLLRDVSGVT